MYPFPRLIKEIFTNRNASKLEFMGTHVSHHLCWPWDLDFWMELNNGRTLTIYDLGRIPLAQRTGLLTALKENGWGLTMAGASVRYRRRVRAFDRIEMRSRVIGWDARFFYLEQSMWIKGEPASHILYRSAVTDDQGIVSTDLVNKAIGVTEAENTLPDWAQAWIEAESLRPWPPSC